MLTDTCPPARFQRFEWVLIANGRMGADFAGKRGMVIWSDRPWFDRRAEAWREWTYCVSFVTPECCRSFLESDLQRTGEFGTEQSQLGIRHEISYDTVLDDDTGYVEGSFRLPGRFWQIFAFENADVPEIRHSFGTWESGISSVVFEVPRRVHINHSSIVEVMSKVFEATSWVVVTGPDSMILR